MEFQPVMDNAEYLMYICEIENYISPKIVRKLASFSIEAMWIDGGGLKITIYAKKKIPEKQWITFLENLERYFKRKGSEWNG